MNSTLVKKLVYYGKKHLGLNDLDSIYVTNALYRKLHIEYLPNQQHSELLPNGLYTQQ